VEYPINNILVVIPTITIPLVFHYARWSWTPMRPGTPCVDAMVELLQIAGKGFGPELRDFGARKVQNNGDKWD
jgi:hypothetical protein